MVFQGQQGQKVFRDPLGPQAHLEHQGELDQMEHQVSQASQGKRVILDLGCRVLKAPQDLLDLRDHKDQKEILAFQARQGLQDEQDLMELQDQKVTLGKMDSQGFRDNKVFQVLVVRVLLVLQDCLDPLVLQDYQVYKVIKEILVLLDLKFLGHRENVVVLDFLENVDFQDPQDHQDFKVVMGYQALKVPRVIWE